MQTTLTITKKRSTAVAPLEEDCTMKSSFLAKLFAILSNEEISNIICWSDEGDKFQILNSNKFQNEVIPKYFKHKNLKSFIRQLNLHGFKKLRTKTKLRDDTQDMYKHNFFRRDQPELVAFIKRKISKPIESDEKTEQINSLIEKQKELQEKCRVIHDVTASELYKVVTGIKEDDNTKLFLSALKVFQQVSGGESAYNSESDSRIYNLTRDFLQALGGTTPTCSEKDRLSEVGDDTTAANSVYQDEQFCFLSKSLSDDQLIGGDQLDMDLEPLASPPKKRGNDGSAFGLEGYPDFDTIVQNRIESQQSFDSWMVNNL